MKPRERVSLNIVEAAERGDLEEVQSFVIKKPKILKSFSKFPYLSPIYKAAIYGHFRVVKYLWVEGKSYIPIRVPRTATTSKKSKSLQTVQSNNCLSNSPANLEVALLGAVEFGSMEIIEYLITNGCGLNRYGTEQKTALHIAASKANLKIVKFLVEKGADVNCKDGFGKTPLFYAIITENLSVIRYLIEAKTDIHAQQISTNETAFVYAIRTGYFDAIKALLDAGSHINIKLCDGENMLFEAVRSCSIKVVELLINRKIDLNVIDEHGRKSAAYYAIMLDRLNILRLLVDSGANVNHIDKDKRSLFHYAAIGNKMEYAEILIQKGAVVHINNQDRQYTNAKEAVRDYMKDLVKPRVKITNDMDID